MCRRMVEIEVNTICTCTWTSIFFHRPFVWGVELHSSVVELDLLLVSLPLVYHRLYIPPAVDSCYLVLGVGGLGAVGFSQFSL